MRLQQRAELYVLAMVRERKSDREEMNDFEKWGCYMVLVPMVMLHSEWILCEVFLTEYNQIN